MNEREWEQWEGALRQLRDEPIDEALSAEVRAGVLARIRRERWQRWTVWGAAAAAVLVALGITMMSRAKEAPAVQQAANAPANSRVPDPPHVVRPAQPAVLTPVAKKAARRPRVVPARPRLAKEPMKIHMMTDDPGLVIIWLVGEDSEGGGE